MLRVTVALALALLPLALASPVRAGAGDEKRFDKLIGKFAVSEGDVFFKFRPKVACACLSTVPVQAGFLVRGDQSGDLSCGVPVFDAGNLVTFGACPDFEVLAR